jgi:hypothetical protein
MKEEEKEQAIGGRRGRGRTLYSNLTIILPSSIHG